MKFFLLLITCTLSFKSHGAIELSRQWSRSGLISTNMSYRHLNRMAPLITKDIVVQGNAIDGIKAFKRDSGHEIWSFKVKDGVEGGAALNEDRLFFGGNDGFFYCLDLFSGRVFWKVAVNSESLIHPTVDGGSVFHVTANNTLHSLDKTTGETQWIKTNAAKSSMSLRGQTAPVVKNGIIYVGFSDGRFSAINAQNGREVWSKRIGDDKKFTDVDATAVIADNCILVSSFANSLFCLDKNNGNIIWRHDTGSYQPVMVDGDKVYYPTAGGEIHILDRISGKLIKKIVKIRGLSTEITSYNQYIVYGESLGALVIRNKSDFSKAAEFSTGRGLFSRPTVDPETHQIYIISNDANIFRLDIKNERENPFKWSYEL